MADKLPRGCRPTRRSTRVTGGFALHLPLRAEAERCRRQCAGDSGGLSERKAGSGNSDRELGSDPNWEPGVRAGRVRLSVFRLY